MIVDESISNLPIGALSLGIVLLFLKIGRSQEDSSLPLKSKLKKLDLLGITTIIGAVCCLLLALQLGQESGRWRQSRVVGCLVGAFVLTTAFGLVQWKKGDGATIPLRIFRQRSIFMGAWFLLFLEMAIYVVSPRYYGQD